ncbi:hypothetical protein DM01DRAFT_1340460 [Hesseltinella vesiculosa]|uniref:Coiled-coil SMC6 And NSE5 INteracting (CANIN) domain-containing protein n=1 Tax=Hesseltinella vesiculosa TaxID=101127 RepID=A0A1X2G461_9FUNG|nr:hypothetical protein DM01DRAFT_1340460 [Hesseltinella vesiculosa]
MKTGRRALRARFMNKQESEDEELIKPKRRKVTNAQANREQLEKLFASINAEPLNDNDIPTQPHPSINTQEESPAKEHQFPSLTDPLCTWLYDESDMEDLAHGHQLSSMASRYLELEQSDGLDQILTDDDQATDKPLVYRLFSNPANIPEPALLNVNSDRPVDIAKLYQIQKNAQDTTSRKLFMQSDILFFWYEQGWDSPFTVYQWLFEIVAFETDVMVAQQAYDTLLRLWTPLPSEKLPYDPKSKHNGHLLITTIKRVFEAFGADWPSLARPSQGQNDDRPNTPPVSIHGLGWLVKLIGKSVQLWPQAYHQDDVSYMMYLLLGLAVDPIGILLTREIQAAIDACLNALPTDDWMPWTYSTIDHLGRTLAWRLDILLPMIKTVSPMRSRSLYMRRVFALVTLMRSLRMAETTPSALLTPVSVPCTPPLMSPSTSPSPTTYDDHFGPSLPYSPVFLNENTLAKLLGLVELLLRLNSDEMDCRVIAQQMNLLDVVTSGQGHEFEPIKDDMNALVEKLRMLGRKLGSNKLGSLQRSMASEIVQRLWNRLAYVVQQNGNKLKDGEL